MTDSFDWYNDDSPPAMQEAVYAIELIGTGILSDGEEWGYIKDADVHFEVNNRTVINAIVDTEWGDRIVQLYMPTTLIHADRLWNNRYVTSTMRYMIQAGFNQYDRFKHYI